MCVPAYVQKVIFGSQIRFGMYEKIFSKIKIKNDWPHGKQRGLLSLAPKWKQKQSYNLMSVTVHFSLFCVIRLLKVIFGSQIRFGMYEKIFSKIKIKNDWPHGKQRGLLSLAPKWKQKQSYNLMSVTVHFSLFCVIRLLLLLAQSRVAWCTYRRN